MQTASVNTIADATPNGPILCKDFRELTLQITFQNNVKKHDITMPDVTNSKGPAGACRIFVLLCDPYQHRGLKLSVHGGKLQILVASH